MPAFTKIRRGLKRVARNVNHFLSYHLFLKRRSTTETRVAGFDLVVQPTVFHPGVFRSGEFFASFIERLDLKNKRVVDIGTGSGIMALAAARAGASVLAIDINPSAARSALDNARANGLGDRVIVLCSNLLSAVTPRAQFDVILSNPPLFADEPRDLADRAWNAGPGYRDIALMFEQAHERLAPDGLMYLLILSGSDMELLGTLIRRAGFQARPVHERSSPMGSVQISELRPSVCH
jgi:release factor glutamine methyltransferase